MKFENKSREITKTKFLFFAQLISENQESFLNMLNEPNADELNVDVANPGSGGGGGVGSGGGGGVAAPTGAAAGERPTDATLYLTQQDRDAIERVRSLRIFRYT